MLAKGGALVVVGLYSDGMELPLSLLPLEVINITSSYLGIQQELVELLQLIKEGKVNSVPIIKRQLSDASLAIQDLREGKNIGRYALINY